MRRVLEWLARNWRLKLAALGISLLLWSVVKAEEVVSVYVRGVPVSVSLRDPNWVMAGPPVPGRVALQLTGPVREVLRLAFSHPRVVVPVEDVRDSVMVTGLRAGWVHLSGDLSRTQLDDITPSTVRLRFLRAAPAPGRAGAGGVPAAGPPAVLGRPLAPAGPVPAGTRPESGAVSRRDSAGLRADSAGTRGTR